MKISSITVHYDRLEDRLVLSVSAQDGEIRLLWLTRRLADRLAIALVRLLEGDDASPYGAGELDPAQKHRRKTLARRDAAQCWAQLSARMARKTADPVASLETLPHLLVTRVSLGKPKGRFKLQFFAHTDKLATALFQDRELRQWLDVLRNAYVRADWSSDVWPGWMGGIPERKMA